MYQVFVIWPGPPGSPSRLRTGSLLRAVWTRSLDTARQGLAFHAVSVHILGPGSAGDAPNCITPGAGLAAAMLMSCAVALFARELPRPSTPTDPVWIHMMSSPWGDLTPTYELPWAIMLAIADLAAAARVEVEPALSEVLVPMSLSQLGSHLPRQLDTSGRPAQTKAPTAPRSPPPRPPGPTARARPTSFACQGCRSAGFRSAGIPTGEVSCCTSLSEDMPRSGAAGPLTRVAPSLTMPPLPRRTTRPPLHPPSVPPPGASAPAGSSRGPPLGPQRPASAAPPDPARAGASGDKASGADAATLAHGADPDPHSGGHSGKPRRGECILDPSASDAPALPVRRSSAASHSHRTPAWSPSASRALPRAPPAAKAGPK